MRKKTRSLSARLVLIFVAILLASTVTVGTISYFLNRSSSINMNSERALSVARTVAAAIDTDAFKTVVRTGEKDAYWYELEGVLDETITMNNFVYLYVLHGYDEEDVIYFAEGMVEGDTVDELDFNDREALDFYDENLLSVFAGEEVVSSEIFNADEWGYLVSGLAPIFDEDGAVIGVVGADIAVNDVLDSADRFGLLILVLILGITAVVSVFTALYLRRSIGRPIAELTQVAKKIAGGNPNAVINTRSNTEIGVLADSFRDMITTIKGQADTLKAIASGDLSISVTPRNEDDVINYAFLDMIDQLNAMLSQINRLTAKVVSESGHIANSAQSLAKGASSQSSAIEQLSASITEISIQTKQNADLAVQSAKLADTMQSDATNSFEQMEQLISAVNDINEASNSVHYVMKVIDEIAFQTSILSLNASVEAARAGEHGKGFAVVSKEIQNLSKKTSDSAKETAELIADTLNKTKMGVKLAGDVHGAMVKVVTNVKESNRIADEIAHSSKEQMIAIEQVNQGINQVAVVVSQNSHVAEESASVSSGMSNQASNLSSLVSRFRTKK